MSISKSKIEIIHTVQINATAEKIWKTLTDLETFKIWCSPFAPGVYFEGDWQVGSEIRFVCVNNGSTEGMVSKILINEPGSHLLIEHVGVISQGIALYDGELVESWLPAAEEYKLEPMGDRFLFTIVTQVPIDYEKFFNTTWPKALTLLKEISENTKIL